MYLRVEERFQRGVKAADPVGDPSKARRELGWSTQMSFEGLIASMVETDLQQLGSRA